MKTSTHKIASPIVMLFLALMTGCRHEDAASSLPEASNTPNAPVASNHEWYIFVASNVPESTKVSLKPQLMRLISTAADPGDVIHVVETPSHQPIATLTVPSGNARTRIRKPEIRSQIQRIGRFFRDSPTEGDRSSVANQLEVTSIAATIQGLKRIPAPVRVVLVGTPIYDDSQQAGWSMKGGVVPSDASLKSALCPFASTESMPSGTDIRWLTTSTEWGENQPHRNAVTRFYQLYFQENGGRLTRMTSDPAVAFLIESGDEQLALSSVTADRNTFVGMKSVVRQSRQLDAQPQESLIPVVHSSELTGNPRPEGTESSSQSAEDLEGFLQIAETIPDKIFLAINWVTIGGQPGELCDIDLWIRSHGSSDELNYGRMRTSFGNLYRDVRESGEIEGDAEEYLAWECAEISHDRLSDLTVWLNAYQIRSPVRVRLIVVWKGKRKEAMVEIQTSDGATQKTTRSNSQAWKNVDVTNMF